MDTSISLFSVPSDLATLRRGLYLAVTSLCQAENKTTELIAGLALRGPIQVVAGSEWVPNYGVARLLRRQEADIDALLNRIHLARAFTCYQLLDLLAATRPENTPLLVLDMLHTFYSDDIPLDVRRRVLVRCGHHLQRLSLYRPVAVLTPRISHDDYPRFYTMLAALADEIYQAGIEQPLASQLSLF